MNILFIKAKTRRRRSKSGKSWPSWLRNPRLLKWAFRIGKIIYDLIRLLLFLTGDNDNER